MRIGINVPDELVKRMQPLKRVTNLSQVCREAIKGWVEAYERAQLSANEDSMEDVAARLFHEDAQNQVDWEALGYEDARAWCRAADLVDFQGLFHNLDMDQREGRPLYGAIGLVTIPGIKTFHHRLGEQAQRLVRGSKPQPNALPNEVARATYDRAWLSYVAAVWRMAQERIAAGARARLEARDSSLCKPEAPDRLLADESR